MRHWFLTIYTWKTSLWAPSGTLLAQKPENKILPKNLYQVNCNPIWKKTYKKTKKQKKLGATIFLKTWKTFWAYFRSFVLSILAPLTLYFCNLMQKIKKIPWIIWAPKSLVLPLFKLDDTPTSGKKKSGSFYEQFWGKPSDRQFKDYIETHFMGPISTRIETIHFDVKLLYCVEVKLRLQLKTPCKCLFYILFLFYTFQFNSW